MPYFTPPTVTESAASDKFFGRFGLEVGQSVLLVNGTYVTRPYPWLGEIRPWDGTELIEGETWFQGGRTYEVSEAVALLLSGDGFTVGNGYGQGQYGDGYYGGLA